MKRFALLAALLLLPSLALAHSPFKGIGSFYNGVLHPLLVPAHLTLLLASGLLIGRHPVLHKQRAAIGLLLAAIAGLVASIWAPVWPQLENLLLGATLVLGGLVVLNRQLPASVLLLIGCLTGFAVGIDSNPQVYTGNARTGALIGSGVGLYLIAIYAMGIAEVLQKRHWQQVLLRVIGSWLSAAALLVLSLNLST